MPEPSPDLLTHCAYAAYHARYGTGTLFRHLKPTTAEAWREVARAVLVEREAHTPHIPIAAVRTLASGRPVAEVAEEFGVEVGVVREVEGMVGRGADRCAACGTAMDNVGTMSSVDPRPVFSCSCCGSVVVVGPNPTPEALQDRTNKLYSDPRAEAARRLRAMAAWSDQQGRRQHSAAFFRDLAVEIGKKPESLGLARALLGED